MRNPSSRDRGSSRPVLRPWFDSAAAELSARFSEMLRRPLRLGFTGCRSDAALSGSAELADCVARFPFTAPRSTETGHVDLDAALVSWFVSRSLGDCGEEDSGTRQPTALDLELIKPFMQELLSVFCAALQEREGEPLFEFVGDEAPRRWQLPHDELAVITFVAWEGEDAVGALRVALPTARLRAVEVRLEEAANRITPRPPLLSEAELGELKMQLQVETSTLFLSVGQLARLELGTRVRLSEDPAQLLHLKLGDERIAEGRPTLLGSCKGLVLSSIKLEGERKREDAASMEAS